MDQSKYVNGVTGIYQRLSDRVMQGCLVGAPTTASSQVTGTGASDFNADITAGLVLVDGTKKEFAVQADFDVASAAAALMTAGQSIVYSIIALKNPVAGTISMVSLPGAAATTGSQVALTDAEITALYAVGTQWIRIANVTVNRTADTIITQSADNTVRPTSLPPSLLKN